MSGWDGFNEQVEQLALMMSGATLMSSSFNEWSDFNEWSGFDDEWSGAACL